MNQMDTIYVQRPRVLVTRGLWSEILGRIDPTIAPDDAIVPVIILLLLDYVT